MASKRTQLHQMWGEDIDFTKLSLKTQCEMARGALGRATDQAEAQEFVRILGVLADGERALRKFASKDVTVGVVRSNKTYVTVLVTHGKGSEPVSFVEPLKEFPSNTLKAKVMLVAQ